MTNKSRRKERTTLDKYFASQKECRRILQNERGLTAIEIRDRLGISQVAVNTLLDKCCTWQWKKTNGARRKKVYKWIPARKPSLHLATIMRKDMIDNGHKYSPSITGDRLHAAHRDNSSIKKTKPTRMKEVGMEEQTASEDRYRKLQQEEDATYGFTKNFLVELSDFVDDTKVTLSGIDQRLEQLEIFAKRDNSAIKHLNTECANNSRRMRMNTNQIDLLIPMKLKDKTPHLLSRVWSTVKNYWQEHAGLRVVVYTSLAWLAFWAIAFTYVQYFNI
jgi:uncharacterized coiled-coil protein SlyX